MKAKYILFLLLLVLCSCTSETRRAEMQRVLDHADSLNRAYIPMTGGVDSLLREATKYYDRHGTPNEQLRAHYLLGCAYRDMGEAPAALQSYQDAVDRADTLSDDCDIRRLMSVYGQMAELFDAQNLPMEELRVAQSYGELALREKDTLGYIRNLELMNKAYYLMNDTVRMYRGLEEAQRLYLSHGYVKEAASMNGFMASCQLSKGNIEEAGRLLTTFEKESGLFDSEGNVAASREYYYNIKGQYYQKTGRLFEAEHFYRKALSCGQSLLGYKGLLSLFIQKSDADSVKKYARLYEIAVDSAQNNIQTEALLTTSKLYDYQRFKEKAEAEEKQAQRARARLWYGGIIVFIVLMVCLYYAYHYRKRKREEMRRLYSDYLKVLSKYNEAADELRQMTENSAQFEKSKHQDVELLQQQVATYKKQLESMNNSEILSAFSRSEIVMSFHHKAERNRNIQQPDAKEWKILYDMLTTEIPPIAVLTGGERILSTKELHVFLLLILGFTNIEISKLLDLTPQRFSNLKRIVNRKLFEDDSAATIEANIKKKLLIV